MKVLAKTKRLSYDEWVAQRRHGIGGSDVAAILGVNPYKTPYHVWLEKRA